MSLYYCFHHYKMAESVREQVLTNCLSNGENVVNVECAVCLQICVHPAELPCGHIFCYLCIKGIVNQGRRCAMCRQDIPLDYLDKPRLLKPMDAESISQGFEDGHLWFYEGHNGWWQYDERTSIELECAYQKGERYCDLLIAGFLYVADFDGMLQYRKSDPSRRRRIKRDLATTSKKGIAGLKATKSSNLSSSSSSEINETSQNLPASGSSILNSDLRIFTSCSHDSDQHSEQVQNFQNSSHHSLSTSITSNPANLLEASLTENSASYSRNINLDSVIHDTLDWTIEQIESLNLELLNDYEALSRDVNNYGQWGNDLNQSRFRRVTNNYMSRYLNEGNTSNELLENVLDSVNRVSDVSHLSNNVNDSSEALPVTPDETNSTYSEINSVHSERLLSQPDSPPPLPPPRNRGINRARARRDSPQHSLSLNCETLLQRFISNK